MNSTFARAFKILNDKTDENIPNDKGDAEYAIEGRQLGCWLCNRNSAPNYKGIA